MASLSLRNGIYYIIYWDKLRQKQVRLSCKTKDKARAIRKLKAMQAHLQLYGSAADVATQPKTILLPEEAFALFISTRGYKGRTLTLHQITLRHFIEACGSKPIGAYNNLDNVRFLAWLRSREGRFTPEAAGNTIALHTKNLVTFFNWLRKEKFVSDNPFSKSKEDTPTVEIIPVDTFNQILTKVTNHELQILYRFLLLTGLRIGEALALTWDDVNMEEGLLSVNNAKGNRKDQIPLLDQVADLLNGIRSKHVRIFRYAYQYVLRVWTAACMDATGRKYRLHSIRKTCATILSQTVSPFTLQRYLRHSDIKVTLKYYVHSDLSRIREEVLSSKLMHTPDQITSKNEP